MPPKAHPSRHLSTDAALEAGRGVTHLPDESSLAKHIKTCASCKDKVNRWKGLAAVTRRLRAGHPPEEIVGRARALALKGPRVTAVLGLKAALRYDSARVPLPAGVRGASLSDQVVYHAQEFAVELRVSRTRSRHLVIVVGQITSRAQPARRLGGVPVQLVTANRVAMRAVSNAWGEFYFEADEQEQMWLEVAPEEDRSIRIPLRPEPKTHTSGVDV
jgi:hypothetical protein